MRVVMVIIHQNDTKMRLILFLLTIFNYKLSVLVINFQEVATKFGYLS